MTHSLAPAPGRFVWRGLVRPGLVTIVWALCAAAYATTDTALGSPTAGDCLATAGHQVLSPVSDAMPAEAHAVWIDSHRLRWPGIAPGGRLELVSDMPGTAPLRLTLVRHGAHELLVPSEHRHRLAALHRGALTVQHWHADGTRLAWTATQNGAALDALYPAAASLPVLGPSVGAGSNGAAGTRTTTLTLWAPTASSVSLCLFDDAEGGAAVLVPMARDARTGSWSTRSREDWRGRYYTYLVDVFVRGVGWVRNRVTDPYSVSLSADSRRSLVAHLDDPALMPAGWVAAARRHRQVHARARHNVDMAVYELHVRDFSIQDDSVEPEHRGKYRAFTRSASHGMRQLKALADSGITDLHLLPVFDIATIPERGCTSPVVPDAPPDSPDQQAAVMAGAATDCFNWGYDPFHFSAPEGSYASDARDGAVRVREFRAMVMALHAAGLRVGMDVVYNHMAASGQDEKSVLDRIVPGYYHRYDAKGKVETSTCCANTATERVMMGKLMVDSLLMWARDYRIDSFRFDLMGHQPRQLMVRAKALLRRELGRDIHFIGEGWNFGEVADGRLFRQASQTELGGTGIATFSDRMRDAARGGGHDDNGERMVSRQGWLNGQHVAPNALAQASREDLMRSADLLRLGLAGTLRTYRLDAADGRTIRGEQLRYGSQPAGYAWQPGEVVNYVENHDNQTLWDTNAMRLPAHTSSRDRARVQMLGAALVVFSQGVPYVHAGMEALRSKNLDRNSFDSGDWFNRIDWRFATNHFGEGLPPASDNRSGWAVMGPVLADPSNRPTASDLAWSRATFNDLLKIRRSSSLFRLRSAEDVQRRLTMLGTGPQQNPATLAASLDGRGLAGAGFSRVVYFINTHPESQRLQLSMLAGLPLELHPVHRSDGAGDQRVREQARFDRSSGAFHIPARSAVVFVQP